MMTRKPGGPVALAILIAGAALASTAGAATVYSETNSASGNAIQIYQSAADGSLTLASSVSTGGLGTGAGLGNQGALALSDGGRWLYAVNAGSNDISVFSVSDTGLTLVDRVSSGGTTPISLTAHDQLLYVLNSGDTGNITGFRTSFNGHLHAISDSTRALSSSTAGAAQVGFDRNGDALVVTEKATNRISTYSLDDDRPTGPIVHASNGMTPFGFAFDRRDTLLVSEAFGGHANAAALSSYDLDEPGTLQLISGSVPAEQTAACWVVVARHGRYAYVTNTGSGTVTGYSVARSGALTRLTADGVSGVTGGGPTDAGASADGRTLFVLSPSIGQIVGFRVNEDGSLLKLGSALGAPATATGVVVR
jgi:6-phosphogluconolactonase (cycloisomerase 2 family)